MSQKRMRCLLFLSTLAALALLAGGFLLGRNLPFLSSRNEGPDSTVAPPAARFVPSEDSGSSAGSGRRSGSNPQAVLLRDGPSCVQPALGQPDVDGVVLARADGMANVRALAVAAPAPPTIQESLQKIQKSMERLERTAPATEEMLREYSDLARELRKTLPDIRKTNEELQKLITTVNETVPTARKTLEESQKTLEEARVLSRTWNMVGERVNALLQSNEENLQNIIRSTARLLSEDNVKDVSTIISNLRISSKNFPKMTEQAEEFFRTGKAAQNQFRETLRKQNDLLDQLRGVAPGQQGKSTLQELQEGASKFNRVMTDVRELLQAMARSDGTLRRFIADPALFNHLDDAALMVTRIMPRLDRVLKDMEVFADKLARHPESLGLGGVVRPSTGLKEAPSRMHPPVVPWQHP